MSGHDGEVLVGRIRNICREKGISIAQMEKDLNWSQGLVSRWTKNSPSIGKIKDVVRYLGCSYEVLLGEDIQDDHICNEEKEVLSKKLYDVTVLGGLVWEIGDEKLQNADVQALADDENIKIYYASYETGFFLLVVDKTDEGKMKVGALHNLAGKIWYQEEETEIWMEALLDMIDQEEYQKWNELKTKYFIEQFMRADFNSDK